jgi:hypothetical protein
VLQADRAKATGRGEAPVRGSFTDQSVALTVPSRGRPASAGSRASIPTQGAGSAWETSRRSTVTSVDQRQSYSVSFDLDQVRAGALQARPPARATLSTFRGCSRCLRPFPPCPSALGPIRAPRRCLVRRVCLVAAPLLPLDRPQSSPVALMSRGSAPAARVGASRRARAVTLRHREGEAPHARGVSEALDPQSSVTPPAAVSLVATAGTC